MIMKLLFAAVFLIAVTALVVTEAHRRHPNQKNRKRSRSSRPTIQKSCLHLCLKSPVLKEKFLNEICPDPCEGVTCSGRGSCSRGRCRCLPEFTGCDCQNVVDPCTQIECLNGGTCTNGSCTCTSRFTGNTCETAVCSRQVNIGAPTLRFGTLFATSEFTSTSDTTIDACETSCIETEDCRSYEFVTDNATGLKVCLLYASNIAAISSLSSIVDLIPTNSTTVIVCVSALNCTQIDNVKPYSLDSSTCISGSNVDLDRCQEFCTERPAICISYLFVADINVCSVFNIDVTPFLTSDPTLGSCPVVCTRNVNMTTTSVDTLSNFFRFGIDNIDDCETACNATPDCRSYRFLTDTASCTLYRSDVTSSLSPDSNATTTICI